MTTLRDYLKRSVAAWLIFPPNPSDPTLLSYREVGPQMEQPAAPRLFRAADPTGPDGAAFRRPLRRQQRDQRMLRARRRRSMSAQTRQRPEGVIHAGRPSMILRSTPTREGVGRSMALANAAALAAEQGLRVAMIDWDLEGAGLESFSSMPSPTGGVRVAGRRHRHAARLQACLPESPEEARRKDEPRSKVAFLDDSLPPLTSVLCRVDDRPQQPSMPQALLLTAGLRSGSHFVNYAHNVQTFNWDDFYLSYRRSCLLRVDAIPALEAGRYRLDRQPDRIERDERRLRASSWPTWWSRSVPPICRTSPAWCR